MLKPKIKLEDLFNLSGAVIYNPDAFKPVDRVLIDSRQVKNKCIFLALKGDAFDGHNFVEEAVKKGATAVVIDKAKLKNFDNINVTIITVPDTIKALGELANTWRHKIKAKVISITGSNGKTTTKDFIAELLASKYKVVKTDVNNNNHIGVPLTILSTRYDTDILVIEHGTNHFGEIEYTANIADPDYALITNIGESHLEYLVDKNGVYTEKSKLFDSCLRRNGTIICNNDDVIIRKNTRNIKSKITYGFQKGSDFKGTITGFDETGRPEFNILQNDKSSAFILPVYGEANVRNFLAAYAVSRQFGVGINLIKGAVKKLSSPKGRMNVSNFSNFMLIDDTYNANPVSVKAAISTVRKIRKYKKTLLILGDMFELGKESVKYHLDLLPEIKKVKNIEVLLIGKYMGKLAEQLSSNKISNKHFKSREQLNKFLQTVDYSSYKVVVKGSRGMKMEDFVVVIKERGV